MIVNSIQTVPVAPAIRSESPATFLGKLFSLITSAPARTADIQDTPETVTRPNAEKPLQNRQAQPIATAKATAPSRLQSVRQAWASYRYRPSFAFMARMEGFCLRLDNWAGRIYRNTRPLDHIETGYSQVKRRQTLARMKTGKPSSLFSRGIRRFAGDQLARVSDCIYRARTRTGLASLISVTGLTVGLALKTWAGFNRLLMEECLEVIDPTNMADHFVIGARVQMIPGHFYERSHSIRMAAISQSSTSQGDSMSYQTVCNRYARFGLISWVYKLPHILGL